MILTELLDLISPLDLICVAARLNGKRVNDAKVPKDAQSSTIPLVPLITKFTVVVGEIGRDVVKDHGKALDYGHVTGIFVHRSVTEN